MKKRNVRIIALMLAAVIAAGSPMPVRAADFEIEEEVILGGTGGESTALYEKESEETLFQGTVEVSENEIADQDMQASLDKAANYLKTHVTNPVVNTLGGEWSVLAMARYGNLPEETKKNYLANLYRTLEENQGVLDKRKYTEYSRVVLALTAIGVDPSDVNGYNMLYPLANFKQVNWQGVNGTIYALLALDSKNYEIPKLTEEDLGKGLEQTTREKLIQQILDKQLSDGGWALSGTKSDPDMTAMAIQALAPYYEKNSGVETAVEKALQTLSTMQDENGGFASFGTENLESAAQTVIALSTLNVELLSDEAFIKNGKSVLDYLLSYQLSDGAFKHTPQENTADAMSTDQGTMALVAYNRAVNGKNTLYDMTDVQNGGDEEEETAENIARFRAKLEVLPAQIRIKDQQTVYALISELDQMKKFAEKEEFRGRLQEKLEEISEQIKEETAENIARFRAKLEVLPAQIRIKDQQTVYALISELDQMKKFAEKEEFRGRLQEKLEEISEQIKVVESLDEQIWNEINPLAVTLKDAEKIAELLKIYESIPKENLEYVEHRADLLQADTIVKKLQNGILAKEIFTNVKDSSIDYVYETWNYTLTLRGANNYEPADMKAGVTSEKKDGKYFFTTEESGTLPGNIDLSIKCSGFTSKDYVLYKQENGKSVKAGTATVLGGYLTCSISEGGTYYIQSEPENAGTIEPVFTGTKNLQEIAEQVKETSNKKTTAKAQATSKKDDSKTVKAEVKDNVVAKSELARVKDQDKNLQMEGKMTDGTTYTFTLNGKDIKEEKEINIELKRTSPYDDEIKQLSEHPAVLYFEQSGTFPGVIQVEVPVEKEDGEYLLLYYNPKEQKAEYVQKVEVKDGQTKFLIEKGGAYFIDKRASTKSLKDDTKEKDNFIDADTDEIILQGTKEETKSLSVPYIVGALIACAVVVSGLGYSFTLKKRRRRDRDGDEA